MYNTDKRNKSPGRVLIIEKQKKINQTKQLLPWFCQQLKTKVVGTQVTLQEEEANWRQSFYNKFSGATQRNDRTTGISSSMNQKQAGVHRRTETKPLKIFKAPRKVK